MLMNMQIGHEYLNRTGNVSVASQQINLGNFFLLKGGIWDGKINYGDVIN